MALKFCSFASGSSGNCYLVKSDEAALLVDVGITGKRILTGLEEAGVVPDRLNGILVTHEHVDHVRSLRMISRKAVNAKVYVSGGTLAEVGDRVSGERIIVVSDGEEFYVGDILVRAFAVSHDAAEPLGYSFVCGGRQMTIVTDTGCISEEIFAQVKDADLLVLEANHEVNILRMGAYPYPLKRRILSDRGHLSNEAAGECLCRMLQCRESGKAAPQVLLAHLSRENNTLEQAYLTVRNVLFEQDYYIDKDLTVRIIERDLAGPLVEV